MTRCSISLALMFWLGFRPLAAQSGSWSSLPPALAAAAPAGTKLAAADTVDASPLLLNVRVVRATGFRCYDCPPVQLALATHGADVLLLREPRDLERLWPLVNAGVAREWPLRTVLNALFLATCIPGCHLRAVSTAAEGHAARPGFQPADSLAAIRAPIDRTAPNGWQATSFFVLTESEVFRVVARGRLGGSLSLRVSHLAVASP